VNASITPTTDEVVSALRGQIATIDEEILRLLNERINKVAALRVYKQHQGFPDRDPQREDWLRDHLQRVNQGPLARATIDELHAFLLILTKQESDRLIAVDEPQE
jgi:chorismate mutase